MFEDDSGYIRNDQASILTITCIATYNLGQNYQWIGQRMRNCETPTFPGGDFTLRLLSQPPPPPVAPSANVGAI